MTQSNDSTQSVEGQGSGALLMEPCPCCRVLRPLHVNEETGYGAFEDTVLAVWVQGDCDVCNGWFISNSYEPWYEGDALKGVKSKPVGTWESAAWIGDGPPCGYDHSRKVVTKAENARVIDRLAETLVDRDGLGAENHMLRVEATAARAVIEAARAYVTKWGEPWHSVEPLARKSQADDMDSATHTLAAALAALDALHVDHQESTGEPNGSHD